MAITKNIVVGISDINNEPDAILLRSTELPENINIQVVSSKFAVNSDELIAAIKTVKDFVNKREPISITKNELFVANFAYGEENN